MLTSPEKTRNLPTEPIRMVAPVRRRIQTLTAVMITFARGLVNVSEWLRSHHLSMDLARVTTVVP